MCLVTLQSKKLRDCLCPNVCALQVASLDVFHERPWQPILMGSTLLQTLQSLLNSIACGDSRWILDTHHKRVICRETRWTTNNARQIMIIHLYLKSGTVCLSAWSHLISHTRFPALHYEIDWPSHLAGERSFKRTSPVKLEGAKSRRDFRLFFYQVLNRTLKKLPYLRPLKIHVNKQKRLKILRLPSV